MECAYYFCRCREVPDLRLVFSPWLISHGFTHFFFILLPSLLLGNAVKYFPQCFRYHWLHTSREMLGSFKQPIRGLGSSPVSYRGCSVSRIQTLLPPSKLGGELGRNDQACSRQLLPPSGRARTEGLSPPIAKFGILGTSLAVYKLRLYFQRSEHPSGNYNLPNKCEIHRNFIKILYSSKGSIP